MASKSDIGLGWNRYGKGNVRFLRVVKDSPKHEVHEFTGQIMLEGTFPLIFMLRLPAGYSWRSGLASELSVLFMNSRRCSASSAPRWPPPDLSLPFFPRKICNCLPFFTLWGVCGLLSGLSGSQLSLMKIFASVTAFASPLFSYLPIFL